MIQVSILVHPIKLDQIYVAYTWSEIRNCFGATHLNCNIAPQAQSGDIIFQICSCAYIIRIRFNIERVQQRPALYLYTFVIRPMLYLRKRVRYGTCPFEELHEVFIVLSAVACHDLCRGDGAVTPLSYRAYEGFSNLSI